MCNRSRHFWYCLKANNEYDQRQLKKALDRIHDADNNEGAILPTSNYSEQRFVDAVEQNPAWKNAFLRLHHMMKWLKSLIYLVRFLLFCNVLNTLTSTCSRPNLIFVFVRCATSMSRLTLGIQFPSKMGSTSINHLSTKPNFCFKSLPTLFSLPIKSRPW